jgi:hypothetical protein
MTNLEYNQALKTNFEWNEAAMKDSEIEKLNKLML